MKIGDLVELKLYDKLVEGSVTKVYENEGWRGYVHGVIIGNQTGGHCPNFLFKGD